MVGIGKWCGKMSTYLGVPAGSQEELKTASPLLSSPSSSSSLSVNLLPKADES